MKKIETLLKKIRHPEINNSLFDLGMIGQIEEKKDKVVVELKLPMPEVPIKAMLVDMIKKELKDFAVEIKFSTMDDEEREKFFVLANANWAL
jgi:metal-sulfur cluster biosynthetic enzyme